MNATKIVHDVKTSVRRLTAGLLFGAVAAVGGCGSDPSVITTTTDRTTTQQAYPTSLPPPTTVTTTRTQQITP